ncbi:hypothetical protein ACPESR_13070 [Nocardia testacea]|uniref:hypothetical protein n=1 Tax=Nocardia testacea TaxID=248551 RepID=UPI003C2E0B3E
MVHDSTPFVSGPVPRSVRADIGESDVEEHTIPGVPRSAITISLPRTSALSSQGSRFRRPSWTRLLSLAAVLLVGIVGHAGVSLAQESDAIREVAAPPVYTGTVDNGAACTQEFHTRGFEPESAGTERHPLFLYFVGTNIGRAAGGDAAENAPAAEAVTEAMARRGFVALTVDYDNSLAALLSDHRNQTRCLFSASEPRSLLTVACALDTVDCDLGIAAWGHSQGGAVAHLAPNHDPRVRAVWTTGYAGEMPSTLPKDRLRVVAGENEDNGTGQVLDKAAGFAPGECDEGADTCLRSDGSGWVIVRRSDVETSADHCWFYRRSCTDPVGFLEPSWTDRDSTRPYAIEPNADWIARTARRSS